MSCFRALAHKRSWNIALRHLSAYVLGLTCDRLAHSASTHARPASTSFNVPGLACHVAVQLALLTHPTPFINGSPFTLFHGESSYAAGAVGIAISGSGKSEHGADGMGVGVNWGRLRPLGVEVTVQR